MSNLSKPASELNVKIDNYERLNVEFNVEFVKNSQICQKLIAGKSMWCSGEFAYRWNSQPGLAENLSKRSLFGR